MAPCARRRAVAAALLLRHAATFTYTRAMRRRRGQDTYLIDNEDVGGPLEPLSDYLLVKVDETAEKTSGGIMISTRPRSPADGRRPDRRPGALHPRAARSCPSIVRKATTSCGADMRARTSSTNAKATRLKDRDVQMNEDGELSAAARGPSGQHPDQDPRGEGPTTSGLFRLEAADKASVVGEVIRSGRWSRRLARAAARAVGTRCGSGFRRDGGDIEDEERVSWTAAATWGRGRMVRRGGRLGRFDGVQDVAAALLGVSTTDSATLRTARVESRRHGQHPQIIVRRHFHV